MAASLNRQFHDSSDFADFIAGSLVSTIFCHGCMFAFYRLEKPILEFLYGAKNGVHAFGYNSAESEPIWMKSGAL